MKFSIIVPTYNRAHLIRHTLNSLIDQRVEDFEIIVVDDGSTDDTEDIVKSIRNTKITYYKIANGERAAARNFGAAKAKGDFLNFFDSDDLAYPNHLSVASSLIKKFDPYLFALNYEIKDNTNKIIYAGPRFKNINQQLIHGNLLNCNPVFVRREIALKFPFDEDKFLTASEDYLLWLKLAARYPICFSNEKTSALIQHDGRSVLSIDKERLIKRKLLMLDKALEDNEIKKYYGKKLKRLKSNTFSYIALHSSMAGYKKTGWDFFKKAVLHDLSSLLKKRSIIIFKNLIFP